MFRRDTRDECSSRSSGEEIQFIDHLIHSMQPLSALDDVVPSAEQRLLLEADAERLRAISRQQAPNHQTFWLDFFSGQTSTAGEIEERTRCTFERLALSVMHHHAPSDGCLGPGRQVRGVEWWVQARSSSGSHEPSMGLHFDSDEVLKGIEGVHTTPWLATVTYLGSRGAPTVILPIVGDSEGHAELLPEMSAASGTFVSYPIAGKHVAFDGGLLHGVLSQMSSHGTTTHDDPFVRCTVLVNIWCNHRPLSAKRLPADIAAQLSDSPHAVCFAGAAPLMASLAPKPPRSCGDAHQQCQDGVDEAWASFDVDFIPQRAICDAHPDWERMTVRSFPFAHPSIGLRYLMPPTTQQPSKASAEPSLFYAPCVEVRLDNAVAVAAAAAIAAATVTAVVALVAATTNAPAAVGAWSMTESGPAMASAAASVLEATVAAAATMADTMAIADALLPASRVIDHRLTAAMAATAAALAMATAATAAATVIVAATATAAKKAEMVAVADSAPALAKRVVPQVFAHRLASQVDTKQQSLADSKILLAIPGRGGVWRPVSDDEHAPDNLTFQRFFTALPRVVRQCLVDRVAVDARVLVEALPNIDAYPTETALDVLCVKSAISAAGCSALRTAVDTRRSLFPDSVDGMPEHQFDITREGLEGYIGKETVAKLWRLPRRLTSQRESGECGESSDLPPANRWTNPEPRYRVELFLRRYSRGTRPLLNFHRDSCAVTVNVALSADEAHTGGRLLAILDDGVQVIVREEGEVTVHPSDVLHAVTAVEAGVRYSLLLFFFIQTGDE